MTITAKDYAELDKDSYNTHNVHDQVFVNGVMYEVIDYVNNPFTGYRGIAYQRSDTHEVAIANRGTEPHDEGKWQDIVVDAGMVLTGLNAQMPDARSFVHRVQKLVEDLAHRNNYATPPITVTGHSLGGAITEILAYENHLAGVTFNGYGAVDLGYHIPQGGTQVTNYVRATDVVSAASHHFGSVVTLATPDDIARLHAAGYGDKVTASDLRNPLSAMNLGAHSIYNFAPAHPGFTRSDLTPENEAIARAHSHAISLYREDMQALRSNTLSLSWELKQKQETALGLAGHAVSAVSHGNLHEASRTVDLAGHRALANAQHAWDTTSHTALLGIHAIDQTAKYVADDIKHDAQTINHGLDRLGHALGSEAVERALGAGIGAVTHGVHGLNDEYERTTTPGVQQSMDNTIPHDSQQSERKSATPQEPISFEARLDRMLAAADAGDWESFDRDTKALADMPAAREMQANAAAMVDMEERLETKHREAMQQLKQELQASIQTLPAMNPNHGRSR